MQPFFCGASREKRICTLTEFRIATTSARQPPFLLRAGSSGQTSAGTSATRPTSALVPVSGRRLRRLELGACGVLASLEALVEGASSVDDGCSSFSLTDSSPEEVP